MRKVWIFLCLISFCVAFKTIGDSLFSVPVNFPKHVYNFEENKLTKEGIELGKQLFNDPLLSSDTSTSCASCHSNYTAFAHIDHALSHGVKNRVGVRNSPALVNLAWSKSFMWDGAIHNLDAQALAPITNHLEMDETINGVVSKLNNSKKYKALFYNAFKDSIATGERTLKSIAQFLVTLVSANSKYDKVMRGEKYFAFNKYEAKGYELFKANCASCHTEPLFTNNNFENNGLKPDKEIDDIGRMKITDNENDKYKFKVPSLRNCEVTYPYMHDGRFPNLQMVLFHYTNDIHETPSLASPLKNKINLTEEDKNCMIAFLRTLTDVQFLNDPKFNP